MKEIITLIKMLLNQEKTDRLLALLKRRYPRWSGFSDQRFARDAAALRPDSLEGIELLNEAALRQLAGERRWDEIIGRIDFVARSAANTSADAPDLGELDGLHQARLDKSAFCEAVIDLMFGEDDGPARLQRYADIAESRGFPLGWALPTLLLMLVHPFTECFIKPEAVSWFLEFTGRPFSLGPVRGETYARLVKLAREVAIHFEDGSMVEMPVIQRLIWICYLENRSEAPSVPAEASVFELPVAVASHAGMAAVSNGADFQIINIDRENDDAAKAPGRHHREAALEPAAFELLEAMGAAPLGHKADKKNRGSSLEKPALTLVRDILGRLPDAVKSQFFSVPLTAYGNERLHAFLNVSFYRKGGKWRGEPQLFFIFSDDGIECGFSIEWYMGVYLERFRANFAKNEPLMSAWLDDAAADQIGLKANRVRGADGTNAYRAESFITDNQEIRVSLSIPREQVLGWSRSRLAAAVSESIVRLFPVLQLALDEDPFADQHEMKAARPAPAAEPALTLLEPETDARLDEVKPIERAAVEAAANDASAADPVPALASAAAIDAAQAAVEAVLSEEFETYDDAARLEPEEVWEIVEPAPAILETPEEAVAGPASAPAEKKTPVEAEASVDEAKPANLLEVLAREVEGRSWVETVRPPAPPAGVPGRRSDALPGADTRAAARVADAAVMEELEAMGIRHRQNAAYPLAQCADETGFAQTQLDDWLSAIERKGQAVFYGPPGTGKTFMAEKLARHLIGGGEGFSRLIQLHSAVSYEDFVEARRPVSSMGREARSVSIPGRFVEFCREAEGRRGTCVLILDEMHRADIANVVGELLYLLEHRDREIQLSGGTRFRVPSNVRVIGTMNTADRSNAFLDSAIRRRFAFLELGPRYEVLRAFHRQTDGMPVEELIGVLETLNRRIANKRFEIGIACFLRLDAGRALESIWRTEIEPLVGDCFFDQPGAADAFTWDAVRVHLSR